MEVMLVAFSIQLRRDNSTNWSSVNPTLLSGEPGVETDTNKIKIGDGISAWNVLPYLVPEVEVPEATPTGAVLPFAGAAAPSGWLMCNGSAVSRTTYANLFSVIGTTFGSGDGSSTFNLPNLNGKTPVGFDVSQSEFNSVGQTGGAKTHTLTTNEMPSHTHTQNSHTHTGSTSSAGSHTHSAGTDSAGSHTHTASTASAGSHDHGDIAASGSHDHAYNVGSSVFRTATTSELTANLTMGTSLGRASTTGTRTHTHAITSAGSHTHTVTVDSGGSHSHNVTIFEDGSHTHTITLDSQTAINQSTGGGQAHNNLQPYIVLNYMIKT